MSVKFSVLFTVAMVATIVSVHAVSGLAVEPENRAASSGKVALVVAFCPTLESNAAAVVLVDPQSGAFEIAARFALPQSQIYGCVANYDPDVFFDRGSQHLYMDFTSVGGAVLDVDLTDVTKANVSRVAVPSDPLFHGFINFFAADSGASMQGITPTVTASGYCNDGCMAFGTMAMADGSSNQVATIPFKAAMDDTHFVDTTKDLMYVQVSYDLREKTCSSNMTDQCLAAINTKTGALVSAKATPGWTVYHYAKSTGTDSSKPVLAWVEGAEKLCEHPYNNFLFAHVSPADASMKPIACIAKDVTVDTQEWVASFNDAETLFATASGNAEAGRMQLLVLEPHTGATVLNSKLDGLPQALGAAQNLTWVWSVDFL